MAFLNHHEFKLGSLVLSQPASELEQIALRGFALSLYSDIDFGSGEKVTRSIPWQVQDGLQIEHLSRGNRTLSARVQIDAPDLAGLEAAERLLWAEVNREVNEIHWTPPADLLGASVSVWDVQDADLAFLYDDLAEMEDGRLRRVFALTLVCLPYARTPELVQIPATGWEPIPQDGLPLPAPSATIIWSGSDALNVDFSPIANTLTLMPDGSARLEYPGSSLEVNFRITNYTSKLDGYIRIKITSPAAGDMSNFLSVTKRGFFGNIQKERPILRVGDYYYFKNNVDTEKNVVISPPAGSNGVMFTCMKS